MFLFLGGFQFLVTKAVAGLIAVCIALAASRRPDRSVLLLLAILPFQTVILAYLFRLGVSIEIVRPLGAWKEGIGIGVLIAAIKAILTKTDVERRRSVFGRVGSALDRVDFLLLAYAGLVLVFALFPRILAPDAPIGSATRSLAFRTTGGFVLLLFAARHAVFPPDFGQRVRRVLLTVGTIVGGIGVFEFLAGAVWNRFAVEQLQVIRYRYFVLNVTPRNWTDIRAYGEIGGQEIVRIGSVFFDPLVVGFFLLTAFAVALERVLRQGLRLGTGLTLASIGGALLFTQTRAAIVGAIVIAMVAFRPLPGRPTRNRIRLALVLSAILVIAAPIAASTGLVDRATGAATGEDESTSMHIDGFWRGMRSLAESPLGNGLGTSAGIGQRGGQAAIVTENYYLQVGVEMGIAGTALFLLATVAVARTLTRVSEHGGDDVAAARGAFIGLAVGAALLHTWNDIATSWTAWGFAGVMLGIAERARPPSAYASVAHRSPTHRRSGRAAMMVPARTES